MRNLLILLLFLSLPGIAQQTGVNFPADSLHTDSTVVTGKDVAAIRGAEQVATSRGDDTRRIMHKIFWVPRFAIDGLLRTAAVSAVVLDETRIIKKFSEVFYLGNTGIGWFPVIDFVSGFEPALGISLFYRQTYFKSRLKAAFANKDIWRARANASHTFFAYNKVWQFNSSIRVDRSDNLRFYGIGSDPLTDSRSAFRENAAFDYGRFAQIRSLVELGIGIRPSANWELFLNTSFLHREISDPSDGDDAFSTIFDVSKLEGFDASNRKWYSELVLRMDTRPNLRRVLPGVRKEAYLGYSLGLDDDPGRIIRTGFDISAFLPVYANTRFLIPRLVLDATIPTNDSLDFVDYARQPAFRGKSRSDILRNDRHSMLASIEYNWPLTYHMNAALFFEELFVTRNLSDLFSDRGPWVAGLQLDMHNPYSELARIYTGYGSEGFIFKLKIGFSSRYTDRSEWK